MALIKIKDKVPKEKDIIYSQKILDTIGKEIYVTYDTTDKQYFLYGENKDEKYYIPETWIGEVIRKPLALQTDEEKELEIHLWHDFRVLLQKESKLPKMLHCLQWLASIAILAATIIFSVKFGSHWWTIVGIFWGLGYIGYCMAINEDYLSNTRLRAARDACKKHNITSLKQLKSTGVSFESYYDHAKDFKDEDIF